MIFFLYRKFGEKMAFLLKLQLVFEKLIITCTLVFFRKTPFFRRKLAKIGENFDHNIDHWKERMKFAKFKCV
jgi:hypothetical protein